MFQKIGGQTGPDREGRSHPGHRLAARLAEAPDQPATIVSPLENEAPMITPSNRIEPSIGISRQYVRWSA